MKEKIIPYQSCSKSLFIFLGIILVLWSVLFSIILISYGAWPITIFLGAEYFLLVYLIRMYFKNKNVAENITINSDEIIIEKVKQDKISKTSIFKTYGQK
jgi:Integral membrane protein